MRHPLQPIQTDEHGTERFKANAIVCYLLDNGGIDMNQLAVLRFSQEDREQFAQLIGYSLSGFAELSYVSDETYRAAVAMSEGSGEQEARIAALESILKESREGMREGVAALFGMCEEDLHGHL